MFETEYLQVELVVGLQPIPAVLRATPSEDFIDWYHFRDAIVQIAEPKDDVMVEHAYTSFHSAAAELAWQVAEFPVNRAERHAGSRGDTFRG